jgi:predicted transcriptional regulator
MTKHRTRLSIRIDPVLAEALDRHCAQSGQTLSRVVQQGVAQYLDAQTAPTLASLAEAVLAHERKPAARAARPSRQRRYRDYVREKRRR